jgi:hypothetical protein
MQLEDYFEFVAVDNIQLKGHRIVGLLTIKQEVITFGIHPRESVDLFNRQKTVKRKLIKLNNF